MGIFGAAHGWGGGGGQKNPLPSLKSVRHILQWWNLAQLYLTWGRLKRHRNTQHTTWVFLKSACFHQKSANFVISRNKDIDCMVIHNYIPFNFSWLFKDIFNKPCYNFDDASEMTTLGLLKILVFRNKGYDVIIPVDYFTNKIVSCDPNYTLNLFIWPKFGNCSIPMREVIKTSILYEFGEKYRFCWRAVLI